MASAQAGHHVSNPELKDPYIYQCGFGNSFASEAIPGVLPKGQNSPQDVKYSLYAEQLTGTAFVANRHNNQRTWVYRIRPAVAHQGFTKMEQNPDLESNFSTLNPRVHISPTQLAWTPFKLPPAGQKVDWIEGLKTVAGSGEPGLREGIAVHVYMANTSMDRKAVCNNDGDLLIVPEKGRLDIQTELGNLMLEPGAEICVIPRGIRFRVVLPDGESRGYVQEVFGAHYELPERGPLGRSGLALERDFEVPVARFEIANQEGWNIVYKVLGELHECKQEHSPFDVVAWHGDYTPYKYDLNRFLNVGSISKDHIDPSIFCVLTVPSSVPGTPLADFLIFSPRWDVANNTFRPPYFHRNCASELMGLIKGSYGGRSDEFQPGGMSYECGFVPHGVDYPTWSEATKMELQPQWISAGTIAFMFESSRPFTLTDYAFKRSGVMHEHEPKMWDPLVARFIERLPEVNADLKKLGLPAIEQGDAKAGNKGIEIKGSAKGGKANGVH